MQFWRGFLAAILVIEMSMLALVLFQFAPTFKGMMADVGEAPRIPLFVLVTSTEWAVGCISGMGVLALAADRLVPTPKTRIIALVLVTVVGAVLLGVTLVGVYMPIFQLAGNIK